MREYLKPVFDTRKSFYNKAYIVRDYGLIELYSYNTKVLEIDTLKNIYKLNYNINTSLLFSNTTLRHIKECLHQFLGLDYNKSELIENNTK